MRAQKDAEAAAAADTTDSAACSEKRRDLAAAVVGQGVDTPLVRLSPVPLAQEVQKTMDIPQLQLVVPALVVMHRLLPAKPDIHEIVQIPQVQFVDTVVVDVFFGMQRQILSECHKWSTSTGVV